MNQWLRLNLWKGENLSTALCTTCADCWLWWGGAMLGIDSDWGTRLCRVGGCRRCEWELRLWSDSVLCLPHCCYTDPRDTQKEAPQAREPPSSSSSLYVPSVWESRRLIHQERAGLPAILFSGLLAQWNQCHHGPKHKPPQILCRVGSWARQPTWTNLNVP